MQAEILFKRKRKDVINKVHANDLYWDSKKTTRAIARLLLGSKNGIVKDYETEIVSSQEEKIPVLVSSSFLYDENLFVNGSIGHIHDNRLKSIRGSTKAIFDTIEKVIDAKSTKEAYETLVLEASQIFSCDNICLLLKENNIFVPGVIIGFNDDDRFDQTYILQTIKECAEYKIPIATEDNENDNLSHFVGRLAKSSIFIPMITDDNIDKILYIESAKKKAFMGIDDKIAIFMYQISKAIERIELIENEAIINERLNHFTRSATAAEISTSFMHEVKNTLNSISLANANMVSLIEKEKKLKNKYKYLDKLYTVRDNIDRAYNLSLKIQRIGNRKLEPVKTIEYINSIIRNAITLVNSNIRKKKIKFETFFDPALDEQKYSGKKKIIGNPIYCDKSQIEQSFINILLNAIDSSHPRSRIKVGTKFDRNAIEIIVRDYGSGISNKNLKKIFDPFYSTKPNGIGLGLYITKIFIEDNHEGTIDVLLKGKGTSFSIRIPTTKLER